MLCPSTAFIPEDELGWDGPTSNDYREFKLETAKLAQKYAILVKGYGDLLECWKYYSLKEPTK